MNPLRPVAQTAFRKFWKALVVFAPLVTAPNCCGEISREPSSCRIVRGVAPFPVWTNGGREIGACGHAAVEHRTAHVMYMKDVFKDKGRLPSLNLSTSHRSLTVTARTEPSSHGKVGGIFP